MRTFLALVILISVFGTPAGTDWESEQLADVLPTAPPNVAANAKIYAWKADGARVLIRDGDGSYTCFARGIYLLRLRKTPTSVL